MNETIDSKKSMERDMAEAIRLHALGFAPRASSSFKFRGHDRVTLGHEVMTVFVFSNVVFLDLFKLNALHHQM